jgi:hypothetical protein
MRPLVPKGLRREALVTKAPKLIETPMPPKRNKPLQIKIMSVSAAAAAAVTDDASSTSSTTSLEDLDTATAPLEDLMGELKQQMRAVNSASQHIAHQIKGLYSRAKHESVEWWSDQLTPRAATRNWIKTRPGLPARPTLEEFIGAVFDAALTMDLETRVMTFKREDAIALWNGQTRQTIFDVIGALPRLFY